MGRREIMFNAIIDNTQKYAHRGDALHYLGPDIDKGIPSVIK
jgi:hypothetical protein